MKFDISGAALNELREFLKEHGEPVFRAEQVFKWVHKQHAITTDEMTNIPITTRNLLDEHGFITVSEVRGKKNDIGGTIKYLLEVRNHNIIGSGNESRDSLGSVFIESVLMRYRHGNALCISTQAGCAMGCAFCASGKSGLIRNLTAGEMLAQVYAAARDSGEAISNITLMGCGEPLDNYDNVMRFISLVNAPEGAGIGQRRITLSTCGLTDRISRLADEKLQITLAVSLHAPNDRIRAEFLPVTKAYPMDGLLNACREYANKTKRRITYEYAMISGKNDRADHAEELAGKLKKTLCHVNLIPVNSEPGSGKRGYRPSAESNISAFKDILMKNGIETTVRRSLGSSISAACGQLVSRVEI